MTERGFRYLVVTLLLAQLLLLLLQRQHLPAEKPAADAVRSEPVPLAARPPTIDTEHAPTNAALLQLIRQSVRAELATFTSQLATATAASKALPSRLSAEQQREQAAQFAQSDALLDAALSLGVWTERDTRHLIPHLSLLSGAQRTALLEKFHGAVNRQELRLEDIPPL